MKMMPIKVDNNFPALKKTHSPKTNTVAASVGTEGAAVEGCAAADAGV